MFNRNKKQFDTTTFLDQITRNLEDGVREVVQEHHIGEEKRMSNLEGIINEFKYVKSGPGMGVYLNGVGPFWTSNGIDIERVTKPAGMPTKVTLTLVADNVLIVQHMEGDNGTQDG